MEDGLVLCSLTTLLHSMQRVLILVVMEDGLVQKEGNLYVAATLGLNPCCDGRWSRTDLIRLF